jgi:hypothetical protein
VLEQRRRSRAAHDANPSTGDPANPGWRRIGASFPAHEGQSLLVVDISAEPPTGTDDTAAVLIDAVNVNVRD